jgi:hypothetical protein
MHRVRFLTALALIALSLATAGVATAKPGGPGNGQGGARPPKARVTWSAPRVEQAVAPGATAQVTVTFTSSADLNDITLKAPGGLAKVMTFAPASFASLKAGETATVTLTFAAPADGARCRAGVIGVRAGGRAIPAALKVKMTVAGATCGA